MTQTSMGTILLVCTSHADLGDTGRKTGLWMEELAAPYYVFKDTGYGVVIASPKGGNPPVDPGSLAEGMRGAVVDRFEADPEAMAAMQGSTRLDAIAGMEPFVGVFLVGGHGAMWDFPEDATLGGLLQQAVVQEKAIGAVCHGVAGLLAEGVPGALKGRSVAGFSNAEEAAIGLTEIVPFLLETSLCEAGFGYCSGAAFSSHVVTHGLLVTGQNPPSSEAVARAMSAALAG